MPQEEAQEEKQLDMKAIDDYIDSLETKDGALITVLHEAQHIYGYLPSQVQNHVAHRLDVPSSKVYGVVTFYSFFTTVPKGDIKISVCMGTACFVRGAQDIVDEFTKQLGIEVGTTTKDYSFSLDSIRCVGACGLAPVVSVNGKVFGRVQASDVARIIEESKAGAQ